jgi:hypothetical protein
MIHQLTATAHVAHSYLLTGLPLDVTQPDPKAYTGPGVSILNWLADGAAAIGLVLCLIAVIAGGVTFAIGRFMKHGEAQKVGIGLVIGGLIGAAIIGSAALIVNTGSHQKL